MTKKEIQRMMWLAFVVVAILIATVVLVRNGVAVIEKYESDANMNGFVENGMCDCCKCGLMDCVECAKRKIECCKTDSTFTRYTFLQNEYGKDKQGEHPSW